MVFSSVGPLLELMVLSNCTASHLVTITVSVDYRYWRKPRSRSHNAGMFNCWCI